MSQKVHTGSCEHVSDLVSKKVGSIPLKCTREPWREAMLPVSNRRTSSRVSWTTLKRPSDGAVVMVTFCHVRADLGGGLGCHES